MLFNSIEFLIFLPLVFLSYWYLVGRNFKNQNVLLLISSYIFYGWWDYRFLALIFLSTIVDYSVAIYITKAKNLKIKKQLKFLSVLFNLGILGVFKYFNFFVDSLKSAFQIHSDYVLTLDIILPVGISFYTFQTMSYTFDVFKNKNNLERNFITFATYVSFFPQLVAGPIERSTNLIPQFSIVRNFSYSKSVDGLRLILWGLFKKVVIADTLAPYVELIFSQHEQMSSGMLWLGAIYFSFQIYCDFSGYSDIAIGTAKLFGIELMSNFKFPYFSKNIAEFWKKWHISLSSWFRDYLYFQLGGSRVSEFITYRNIIIIFLVSGFWHGANWTFLFWGFLHGLLYIPYYLVKRIYKNQRKGTIILNITSIVLNFLIVTVLWVFFRSENLDQAFDYIFRMFTDFTLPDKMRIGILYIALLLFFEYFMKSDERKVLRFNNRNLRLSVYIVLIYLIFLNFNLNPSDFIYFQF
jgi:alginate O-acetyltransferase complex protein AlgI